MNLSLVISTLWIIYLTGITWRRFYQVGVLITRLNRNTSHVELEVFATWDFFLHEYLSMTPLLVFKYWHCLQPRSWELRKYFPKFQTLFIDFLIFSNFHHGFLFFFLVFISPTSFQSWYIYDVSCIFWNTTPTWIRLFYLSMRWLFDSQRDLFLYKKWGIFTAIPSYPYVKQLIASQSIDYEFLNEIVCES